MRKWAAVSAGAAVWLVAASAAAQQFTDRGTMAFSVERLMGIQYSHVSEDEGPNQPNATDSFTTVSFFWRGQIQGSAFDVPRFAFDYFVIPRLSVGGSIGFANISAGQGGSLSEFEVAPRVGYGVMFNNVFGIWPRGGFTYHSANNDPEDENGFALTFECPFPIIPFRHFAVEVGPTFDIDLFGNHDLGNGQSHSLHYYSFALQVGVFGWM
jgi:hypothetical protein